MKIYLNAFLAIILFTCLATQAQAQCADETERMKFVEAVRANCATCIDGSNQIDDAEAAKVTVLDVSYNNLTCMDGIDKFIALKSLECQGNKLVSLPDLYDNFALQQLYCESNLLTSLPNLSQNTALEILSCTRNYLTNLPDLSKNKALRLLYGGLNHLTSLPDLSNNMALIHLFVWENQLSNLPDLSKNTALEELVCRDNQLTSIPDLSKQTALTRLWCNNNPLCSIGNLPNSITELSIKKAIDCLPNIPSNLVLLDELPVLLHPELLASYSKCTPKVFTAPKVSFTSSDNLCIFQKGAFDITSPIWKDVKYVWDFGDGSTSELLHPTHDYAKAGEYEVTLSTTKVLDCGEERASTSKKITVNPTIAPKINYPTVVCPNDESEFSTSAACGKLEWVVSGGTISSGQGSSKIKVLWGDGKNGNGKVTLLASQCGSGYCEIPVSVEIPIVPTDFSINGSNNACQYEQNTYRINFKGNALSTIFTWTVTGGTVVGGKLSGYGLDSIQVLWGSESAGKITLSTRNEILTKCGGTAVLDVQLKPSFAISGLTKVCANGASVYSSNNFDSYNWSVEGNNSIDPLGKVSWGSKAGLYNVIATPIAADYCNIADTVQVRVADNPVISAIEGALEVDPNSVQVYKALVDSANTPVDWEVTNGVIQNTNGLYATVKWDASGGYALKATARGSPNCVSKSVEMKVKTNPVFTISGPASVCISDVVPYTVTSDAIGNVIYLWKTLGGAKDQNPTSVNNSIAFLNPGKQQVTLEAKTNGKTFLATKEVFVSALPTSLLVQGSLFIDPSSNSTFVYNVQNPENLDFDVQVTGATNYSVSGNEIRITWGTSEPYSVQVIGKKAGELCKGVPVTLQVQKIPFLLNEIKTTTAACLNTEVEYSFKPDKFVKTLVWSISGGGTIVSQTDSTLKVLWGNMPGNFTVSLAYDHFGAKLASLPVNLNELPKPEINKVTICGENAATLSVKGSYASYEWFKEGEISSISSTSTPSITTEGMYLVKVKDLNGCTGISNQYVEQSPLPNADIFVDQSSFCQDLNGVPKSVTISALEGVNYTYQWYKDNTVITNATQSVLQVNVPLNAISKHSYWVHIERKGCSNESIKKELQVIDCGTVDPGGGNPCTEPAVTFTYSSNCQPIAFSTSETNATWDFGDGTTSALSSITKTFSKAGIYNVSLSKGCSAFSRSIEIAVNPLFKLTSPTCQNQASSFKDFSTNLPSIKIDSWTWDFGDNSPIVTGSGTGSRDVSHVFANIGTYLVTLTLYTKASNQNNCTYSYKVPVTIKESPVASFETVIPSCAESEYMFNLLQKDPTWSYLWKFDLSNTSVVESPSINFSTIGSHEVKLVVKNLYCKDSTTKTIQVVAPEQAEKLQVSGNTLLCNGSKVTLISPPADGYVWEKNGVVMPINTSDIEVSTAGKYRVTYSKGSCDIITDEIEIRQFLSGAQVEGPLVFCSGDLVQFDTKLSSDLYTFAWTKNNQPLLSTSSVLSLPNITNAEDGYYQVTVTDRQNGCFAKLPSKYIQVNQKQPKPVLVANKNTVCAGEALELKTTSDVFFKTILWFKSGQLLNEQSSSLKIPITSVSDAGTYRLMIFDNNTACSDFTDIEVKVIAPIVLNIGADKEVCQGKALTLSANLPANYTYEWYLNNSLLSQETSSSLTIKEMSASKAGDYEVKATANTEGNCVATSNKLKISMLSLPAQAVISGNSTLCSGDTVLLTSNVSSNIEWNTGETTPDIKVIRGGQYLLKVKNPTTGCYSEQTKVITQYLSPDFGFFPAGVYSLCGSNEVSFDGLKSYPTFQWYLDGQKLRNPDFNLFPTKTGKYTVEVETKDGCKRTSDTLRITSLECPCLVTNTNDAGDGSLREAINCANNKIGKDKIKFAIPGTGPFTISPLTPLPSITDSVVINGFSQAGEGKYHIILDGSLSPQDGLVIATGIVNSEITGLEFENFNSAIVLNELVSNTLVYKNNISSSKGSAIYLNTSSNNRITKNQILEANIGIELNGSDKNTIDSNVVSKNRSHGILVQNSQSAQLKRNYIGTDVQMSDLGNAGFGILLQDGSNNAVVSQNFLMYNKESNIGARLNSDYNYFNRNLVAFSPGKGINLELNGDFGNQKIQAPTILSAKLVGDSVEIIGTSNTNETIHLYSGDGGVDNALAFVKTTVSAFDNSWIIRLPLSYFNAAPFYYFLATTTDYQYNTSEFSNVFKYENCVLTGIQNTQFSVESPICVGSKSVLTIKSSESTYQYQVFEKAKAVSSLIKGIGNDLLVEILGLEAGNHTLTIHVSKAGCISDTIKNTPNVVVNTDPKTDLSVGTNGSVCNGNQAKFFILKPEIGTTYQIFDGQAAVSQTEIGKGDSLILSLNKLSIGDHSLKARATKAGCKVAELGAGGTITINSAPKTNLEAVINGPVCLGNEAEVKIYPSEIGKFYEVQKNRAAISDQKTGTGDTLKLTVNTTTLQAGEHKLTVGVSVAGCVADTLVSNLKLKINTETRSDISFLKGSSICMNEELAQVTVLKAEKDIHYRMNYFNTVYSEIGTGQDLVFEIPKDSLSQGRNEVSFYGTSRGCKTVKLDNTANVFLLGSKNTIQGASILCYNSIGNFSINPIEGALSYNWTVPLVDTLLSGQGTNQVLVSIGQKESEIKVVPVGTNRACQESEASLNVHVFPRFRGLNFQKTDTACINQTYLFSLDSTLAIGVKSLKWTWTSGIRIESPIVSSTKKAQSTFVQSGIQQLILSPTEECTGLVRKPDTLTIHVLEYPVAEAGEYDVIENDLQQPTFLNGTGSSESGINLNEKYLINWTSPNLFVQNSHLLVNASFVPVEEETKVYLTIAHAGKQGRGYCEAKDSVVIKIKPLIDVPNVFSPNQDRTHDVWEIPHLNHLFPNCSVEVFNKWGTTVFQSIGYAEPWDGTRNGMDLPISTYYYIIDLKNGSKPMVKSVTILR